MNVRKPKGYWTFEKCKEIASKYNTRTEFNINDKGCYLQAWMNGWLDDICSHMENLGNKYKRCIYSYEFTDNYVYIGLTYNLQKRQSNRDWDTTDQVNKYIKKSNLQPIRKQLTDYIDVEDAVKLEKYYVEKYKNEGWNILNKSKTGGIGGVTLKWIYIKCKEEALKYDTRKEFKEGSTSAYYSAIKHKWLDDVCSHMNYKKTNPSGYWTKEKCREELLKYKSIKMFKLKSGSAYNASLRNNWLDDISSDIRINVIWTKEKCREEALKYDYRSELKKKSTNAYESAKRYGWLNDICKHMVELKKPSDFWTFERCQKEAFKYKTKIDFEKNCGGAFSASKRNGWLDDFFKNNKKI